MDNSTLSIELEIFTPYELVRWREKGKFNEIKLPEKKVWSKMKRSQWIESLLLGIVAPPLYVSEDYDGNLNIIDGVNRLHTIFEFLDNKLQLRGLPILQDINGVSYDNLPIYLKSKFQNAKVAICIIKPGTPARTIAEIVKRINYRPASIPIDASINF